MSDAKALTAKVQSLTDEMAGTKGQIIDQPIFLHITSAHAPDLTLVDLPGIAKNPLVDSEQSDDIEDITKSLISKFIDSPETVILAVVPANMDAADALKALASTIRRWSGPSALSRSSISWTRGRQRPSCCRART